MQEIDIRDIIHILKKRFLIVIGITLVIFIMGAIYTYKIVTPQYQSTTTIYIGRNVTEGLGTEALIYQDLLLGDELVNDYRELVKSRLVADAVSSIIAETDVTSEYVTNHVEVSSKTNTRVIEISATTDRPYVSRAMANATAEIFTEKAIEIMNVENVQIIDKAILSRTPIKPNKMMNLAISLLIGLMVGVGIVFLMEFMDNKIRTAEDVQEILELPVLGIILSFEKEKDFSKKMDIKKGANQNG